MQEFIKQILFYLIAPAVSSFTLIYLWIKLFDIKYYYKKPKIYISYLFLFIMGVINNNVIPQKYKIITFSIICIFTVLVFFNKKIEYTITASLTGQALGMISEIITVILLSMIVKENNITEFLKTNKGFILVNLGVAIIGTIIIKTKLLNFLYMLLNKITNIIKTKKLIIYTIILIITANILTYLSYYKISLNIILIINTILIIIYSIITYYTIKTDNKYQKIYNKYNLSLDTLKENENLLDDYKMYSHENSNTLKTIRSMIETNDKNVLNYINTVINDKEKQDEGIINETSIIPISGLKALLYSKFKDMRKLGIKSELYVDKSIKASDLINIDDETLLDVCKIIGVFIDNAIEATKDLENKQINISLHNDNNNIVIEVANTFSGKIDVDKISLKGYTTKGGKHGYGLSLVKTILEHNKKLKNTKQINNTIFIQELEILK